VLEARRLSDTLHPLVVDAPNTQLHKNNSTFRIGHLLSILNLLRFRLAERVKRKFFL